MKSPLLISSVALLWALSSCTKEPVSDIAVSNENTAEKTLSDFSDLIVTPIYLELADKTAALKTEAELLKNTPNETHLEHCRQLWKDARSSWEKSEAFLFGPVSTDNIDPRIDTWPVNFLDLEGELAGSHEFTTAYIDGLQDALKGFHPIEYLLFGADGNKTSADFSSRELDYLVALSDNLSALTASLAQSWNDQYAAQVKNAGMNGSVYSTRIAALEEIVNALSGICGEVADGKMNEPFLLQDATLEESPFASNSITDFTNNIRGVEAVYLARLNEDGMGLEDLVRAKNLSLDGRIKNNIAQAIAALQNITVPFGQAIFTQQVQVQNAITSIQELEEILSAELLPFVQSQVSE